MKLIFRMILLMPFTFLFVSCGGDSDDDSFNPPAQAEETTGTGTGTGNSSEVRTLRRYKCYAGENRTALTLAHEVRRERTSTGKRRYFLYNCQGTNTCTPAFALTKKFIGEGEEHLSCMISDNGFSLCVSDALVIEETNHGELLEVSSSNDEFLYCNPNIPL